MRETALDREGRLDLKGKSWWSRAMTLRLGEQLVLDAEGGPKGAMLVRREELRNRSGPTEALVWIIDDDGDGSARSGGDRDSDCYVVDYGPDGVVDRMVDYLDDDGDQDPDEMDIRYFEGGELRQLWCGLDLDDDGAMWHLAGYEYSGDFFQSDPYGDGLIFMNKLDPERGEWVPISECPFAFYDTDRDGYSEVVIRVSAVPLDYDRDADPDYANDPRRYRGAWRDSMRRMGIVNIRYSLDADDLSGSSEPLHYDFGFNLVGAAPYEFPGMDRLNPRRRPPQTTRVIPHEDLRAIADRFVARETGFSWQECPDDTVAIGGPTGKELDFRWEGVFWIWERRFMENTGGPTQRWNVRREWTGREADRRQLYYSGVDRRIHLAGAEEGWLEVGHLGGLGPLGEVRMLDGDGNGYFDRWEVYVGDEPLPARVTTVRDEKVRPVPFDEDEIVRLYTREIIPEARAANARLLEAMEAVHALALPEGLRDAMQTGSPSHRRYAEDVARELHYLELRRHLTRAAHRVLRETKPDDLRRLNEERRRTTANSQTAWKAVRLLQSLDVAYGEGEYDEACRLLAQLAEVKAVLERR